MFLKNKNIILKIRRSKVTDYAALTIVNKVFRHCHFWLARQYHVLMMVFTEKLRAIHIKVGDS